ncbi:MAG: hypothetical protein J7L20_03755 [Thermoplasmata archaeon]|nr:hypothetical protein [Thermoplasmata archaeon]
MDKLKLVLSNIIKFFTLPPYRISWPYVLINARNYEGGLRYIRKHKNAVKAVIIDSGIEIFRNPRIKDYPKDWVYRLLMIYKMVKKEVPHAEVRLTCPDYCDDYHPKSLWLSEEITNIERTVENVRKYYFKYDWVNWLIVVQGHYKKPESVKRCLDLYEELGVLEKHDYFAIGNLCVERSDRIVLKTARIVRRRLRKDKKIHVFGMKLGCVRKLQGLINSFDTMAWTRPVSKKKLGVCWSCKNEGRAG